MKKKAIEIPIFRGTLLIIVDKDLSYVEKEFKTRSLKNYGAVTLRVKKKYQNYVVAFEDDDMSLIAHEVVHLVNFIFKDCGIKLNRKNDETQAYLTGWLFNEIQKVFS